MSWRKASQRLILCLMYPFGNYMYRRLRSEIDHNRVTGQIAEDATFALSLRVKALERTNEALWSLLKEKLGYTDEELIQQAEKFEVEHGADLCPACGKHLLVKHGSTCSWCGERLAP